MSQLPADCLDEIFEYLENDKVTLHSCLLVNRLWCKVSVRILWKSVWNYRTLIACLPVESKDILYKNKIIIPSNSKPPLFNYSTFIKRLKIDSTDSTIKNILKNYQSITLQDVNYKKYIIAQEIFKIVNQISSIRELDISNITFPSFPFFPETIYCLKNLSILSCRSDIYPEFFYQLSQMCYNIQSLNIRFEEIISNGLTDLISVQQNLKYLKMIQTYDNATDLKDIVSSLKNLPNTLVKLNIYGNIYGNNYIPLLFIAKFTNLQELTLSFYYENFMEFEKLQYVTFSQLQILKFHEGGPRSEVLIIFLENNGKNLKELHIGYFDGNYNSLNLSIATFCPNLRKLYTDFKNDELEALKIIFNSCKYLESFKFLWRDSMYLSEENAFEVIAKYSPENFHELLIRLSYKDIRSKLLIERLESFFISWASCVPQKSLSLILGDVSKIYFEKNCKNMKVVIETYIKLGVIKEVKFHEDDDDDIHFIL